MILSIHSFIYLFTHICICAWGVLNIPIWFVCLTWYGLSLHDIDLSSMLRYVCVLHTCVFTCLQVSRVSAEGNFNRKRWKRWRSLKLSHKSIQYINIVVIYCCREFVYGDSLNTLKTLGNFAKIALAFRWLLLSRLPYHPGHPKDRRRSRCSPRAAQSPVTWLENPPAPAIETSMAVGDVPAGIVIGSVDSWIIFFETLPEFLRTCSHPILGRNFMKTWPWNHCLHPGVHVKLA